MESAGKGTARSEALALCDNIERVILGKGRAVRRVVAGLLAVGHVLIEDVPGVGKTTLARALARSLDSPFQRIQFTPDLLPTDILGVSVLDREGREFEFKPGPIFTGVLLADEINRTTPRTQSALLEAMNVGQVSVDGSTYDLPRPFFVMATQNPLEFTGTYALPESQLDRFTLCLRLDYPDRERERQVLESRRLADPLDTLEPVLTAEQVLAIQEQVRRIRIDDKVLDYLQDILAATRSHPRLQVGASPRAGLNLSRLAQACALLEGREYVLPDDIKALAVEALAHRVVLKEQALTRDGAVARVQAIQQVLAKVPVR